MTETEPPAFATRVATLSERYLEAVLGCVRALRTGIDDYLAGEAFDAAASRVAALEGDCDDALRDVREAVVGMPPSFSNLYLRPGEAVTFFDRADEIANRAEALADDVRVMEPSLGPVDGNVSVIAEEIVAMTETLSEAAALHFADPTGPGAAEEIRPLVGEIRERERRCDREREAALEAVFADGPTAAALATREVIVALDGVADAVEDAADHLIYVEQVAR
ncbi:MAG: hypothetical protein ABEJ68_06985 [Halobacteriaceae archaeon]